MKFTETVKVVLLGGVAMLASCAAPPMGSGDSGVASEAPMPVKQEVELARQRPGLGTGWGEQVDSKIRYGSFERASTKPKAMEVIYYNNKEGVEAMSQGWRYTGSGMQTAAGGLVEWGVKTGWGYAKNVHSGGRRYVVGKDKASYSIVVKNRCHSRLELVMSVDGLDVMDGKPASVKKRGYVIDAGKTLVVKGFRTSEDAVAAFKFSSVSQSYSNLKHGTTRNVGVIGMAVYTEKGVSPWRWSQAEKAARTDAKAFAEAPLIKAR
ncbi:hypothetical protein [Rubritalea tangerina]|uniref:DUF4861 domain-containing protein n=1 Tax=Rubritalea tangerina TaxID=430798 RepID=A0ABW4Z909_9BACT